jgi:hypothetical protein
MCVACLPTLQEELQQQRKTLRVALGPSEPPPAPPAQQQQQQGGQQGGQQQQQQNGGAGGSLADSVKSNPVISKFFQVGPCCAALRCAVL